MELLRFGAVAHPLLPGGGLFIAIVGVFVIAGGAWQGARYALLIAGLVAAGCSMALFAARLSRPFGPPPRVQVLALVLAIGLEIPAVAVVRRRTSSEAAVLLVVALHFLVMWPAFGPSVACLGVAGATNAIVALKSRTDPSRAWSIDGALKLVGGALMLYLPFASFGR